MRKYLHIVFSLFVTLSLSGCGGGGSSQASTTPVTSTNQAPVYRGGLAAGYGQFNDRPVALDVAHFSDANGDALTIRYFTVDSEGQRSYLENQTFSCAKGIVAAGVEASDGELTAEFDVPVTCWVNQQEITTALENVQVDMKIAAMHPTPAAHPKASTIQFTLAMDLSGSGSVDSVIGVGQNCQSEDVEAFNKSPAIPAVDGNPTQYDQFAQYVICISGKNH